ncbi:hypothetical protein H9P43_008876 [Blastocladiella emersonii ATCC 22665]|nr:hypothetical protein H9P43_008876 [Blastocladiella emersonii ATCC 22665]
MSSVSLLARDDVRIMVSSVCNRDTATYGKQHLTDGNPETCWNSDQGSPQRIAVDFGRPVLISSIELTFQGGFVGTPCEIFANTSGGSAVAPWWTAYPEDTNAPQSFRVPDNIAATAAAPVSRIKLVFPASSDFYGRVTVYRLDVLGREAD